MSNASLIIGAGNWATKPSETLGYKPTTKGFTPKEGDHARASIGSYTDRNGALQTGRATNYGGNILLNPTFAPEILGAELFENSDFQAATGWTLGAGWSIAGGQASGSGIAGQISQDLTVEAGKAYKIIIDIASMTGVGLYLFVDGLTKLSISDTDTGVHTTYYIAEEDKTITIAAQCIGGADTAVLDSLGAQETNSTWNATDASIEFDDFELKFVSTPGFRNISQYLETLPVTNVRMKLNITSHTEGGVRILCGGYSSEFFNTVGEHEITFTTDGIDSLFIIETEETTTLSINIVELQELTETDENVDELRVDFSENTNGVMLLEDAATNLITDSEDFTQSVWDKTFVNVDSTNNLSPDNSLTASKIISSNITNEISLLKFSTNQDQTLAYSCSIFFKKDEYNYAFIELNANGDPQAYVRCVINLENGNIEAQDVGVNTDLKDIKVILSGNGFYYITVSANQLNVSDDGDVQFNFRGQNNSNISTETIADGVSGIFVWGVQLEVGDKATSYIPTNGSTRLREADKATNFGTVQDFNQDELVIAAKIKAHSDDGTDRYIAIDDGTTNAFIYLGFLSNSRMTVAINYLGNNTQYVTTPNEIDITQNNEIVTCLTKTSIETFINGISKSMVSPIDTPVNAELKTLYFDKSGKEFYGKAEFISTYGSRLEAKTDFPYL